jgi:hypothetical protein
MDTVILALALIAFLGMIGSWLALPGTVAVTNPAAAPGTAAAPAPVTAPVPA